MSKFSEHLDKCISNSGMTENQLAKMSGFNRSYIALMKNGQRVSPDTEKMVKLLDVICSPYGRQWKYPKIYHMRSIFLCLGNSIVRS